MCSSPKMIWTFYEYNQNTNTLKSGDSDYFENKKFIRNLDSKNDPKPSGSRTFWDALAISNRVLIVDNYLKPFQIKILINELNLKYDYFKKYQNNCLKKQIIEFICLNNCNVSLFYSMNKNLKNKLINISYYNCLVKKQIHDRFVILDDEIWTFGAAFANLHGGFTVATRGWIDKNNELRSFFDGIINKNKQFSSNKLNFSNLQLQNNVSGSSI